MPLRATEGDESCVGPLADAPGAVCTFVRNHETVTEPRPKGGVVFRSGPEERVDTLALVTATQFR